MSALSGNSGKNVLPLVYALDEPWEESKLWLDRLSDRVWGFKVGSILFTERGPEVVHEIKKRGSRVFLDLKFLDIPNTARHSVKNAFAMGVDWLTIHASGGREMIQACVEEERDSQKVLAVTVLTSADRTDLEDLGIQRNPEDQVLALAKMASKSGASAFVCSPLEVAGLKREFPEALLVTPGVRLTKEISNDQKRVASVHEAIEAGSHYVVIGRGLRADPHWEASLETLRKTLSL